MQLVAYGAQDVYLTGNPQITFFKVVYRRHTNFAMESIQQSFNGNPNVGQRASCTISRNGDLISRMWLRATIPEVSMSFKDDGNTVGTISATSTLHLARKFGLALVKNVELEIGGQKIDKHYGDWMNIWNELSLPESKRDAYTKLVGDGEFATNGHKELEAFTYGGFTSAEKMSASGTVGVIPEQVVNVPLEFWFCRNPGLALPLIALQYHEVKVNVELNESKYLGMISVDFKVNHTVVDTTNQAAHATIKIGTSAQTFTLPLGKDTVDGDVHYYKRALLTSLSLSSCSLWVDYIYLDTDERRRFAQTSHEYLIEQLQFNTSETVAAVNSTIDLNFNHPVKELVWVAQPANNLTETTYASDTYSGAVATPNGTPITFDVILAAHGDVDLTGWYIVYIDNGIAQTAQLITAFDKSTNTATVGTSFAVNVNDSGTDTYIVYPPAAPAAITNLSHGQFDYQFYRENDNDSTQDTKFVSKRVVNEDIYPVNPVVNAQIKLNGHDRFEVRGGEYFNVVQPFQHHTRAPLDKGINVYSFALKPEEHQPSGTCNMSRIDQANLRLTLRNNETHNVRVYATNYNVLRIMSGMGGLAFAN